MTHTRVLYAVLLGLTAFSTSCNKQKSVSKETLTTTYHHTYGTELKSEQEWISRGASGEIVRHETNGILIRENYREGVLDGVTSWTFPHSDRLQRIAYYRNGNIVQEIFNYTTGAPREKKVYNEMNQTHLTAWYENGSPRCNEEYFGEKLLKGEYFTLKNEQEALLVNSTGTRPQRDSKGVLIAEEIIANGELKLQKTFYPSGAVQAVVPLANGKVQGVLKTFFENGEPKALEEWNDGRLEGTVTLFQNGERIATVPYSRGLKEGTEVRFKAGTDVVEEEISWVNDRRHGPTTCYAGSNSRTEWYFGGDKVSRSGTIQ